MPWLTASLAAVVVTLAFQQQHQVGRSAKFLVSDLVPGLTMVACGLVIRRRRPHNRCWWLLVASGLSWYVGDFEHHRDPNIALFGFAFSRWYAVFLAWAVLAFPSGRLHHRHARLLLAAIFVLLAVRSLSRIFLHVPPDVAGYGTTNRFLPISDGQWWQRVEDGFAIGFAGATGLVLVSIAVRWARSGRPGRQMIAPALFAAAVLAAGVTYEYIIGWNGVFGAPTGPRVFYVVWWSYAALAIALAGGLIRLRRTRSAVVDLVAELGDRPAAPAALGAAISRALGDRTITLLPWSTTAGSYVGGDGVPTLLTSNEPEQAFTIIERDGEPLAALRHDIALLEDPGLVSAVVAAVRLTIDNERLRAELETQLAEVAASRTRILNAGDAERRRIERDLHDGAQQRLVTIALRLRLAGSQMAGQMEPEVKAMLSRTMTDLTDAIDELRDLARGIHPAVLTEFGLAAALESLVDRSPVPVALDVQFGRDPDGPIAATAYFAVAEALSNVVKHAGASTVSVRATGDHDAILIEVLDDGRGGANIMHGTGLRGIADRVATVGGTLRVSSPSGIGTRFELELPCASS